jgi:hypothetical protein
MGVQQVLAPKTLRRIYVQVEKEKALFFFLPRPSFRPVVRVREPERRKKIPTLTNEYTRAAFQNGWRVASTFEKRKKRNRFFFLN